MRKNRPKAYSLEFREEALRQVQEGSTGHAAMMPGGTSYAGRRGSGEHWFDGSSRLMIDAGA